MIFITFFFIGMTLILLKFIYKFLFPEQPPITEVYREQWFGRGPRPQTNDGNFEDTSLRPFKINVSDEILADLKSRLEKTRFEDPVEDSKFYYGFNMNYLRKVVDYWKKEYDWRKHEKMLNQFPQYKTRIEGIDVHYLHVKPNLPEGSKEKVLPLLMVHGWPGSVAEFCKIIPLLTTPRPGRDFVFEMICPSIPGYGFSESPHQKGFNIPAAGRIIVTLMERIGHRQFYVQGGDWGSAIVSFISRYYPSKVLGLHLNMYMGDPEPWDVIKYVLSKCLPFLFGKLQNSPIEKLLYVMTVEGGYFHMQSTKPDTLGCGMADSPAGMAAWIIEKFSDLIHPEYMKLEDGGLTEKFALDELLTNVMLYWVNNNFTAAARFYKENVMEVIKRTHQKTPIHVPSAVAIFPNELGINSKEGMSHQLKNLISCNTMPRGGHFAAMEEPDLLADDIWQFVEKVEN